MSQVRSQLFVDLCHIAEDFSDGVKIENVVFKFIMLKKTCSEVHDSERLSGKTCQRSCPELD